MKRQNVRIFRSFVALVTLLCAIVGMASVLYVSADSNTLNYVSLGDSMTNGFGLDGYDDLHKGEGYYEYTNGYKDYGYEAYPNQFAEYLATLDQNGDGEKDIVNHSQLAMSAMRIEDLNFLLHFDYNNPEQVAFVKDADKDNWSKGVEAEWNKLFAYGDRWTLSEFVNDYRFHQWYRGETDENSVSFLMGKTAANYQSLADVQANPTPAFAYEMQEAVKDADIISIGSGNSNFGVFLLGRIMNCIGFGGGSIEYDAWIDFDRALDSLNGEYASHTKTIVSQIQTTIKEQLNSLSAAGLPTETVEALYNAMAYTVVSYLVNYVQATDRIMALKASNKDVTKQDVELIYVGLMNTLNGFIVELNVDGAKKTIDLGVYMDKALTLANTYIASYATLQQLLGNELYATSTFYVAEADDVECLISSFEKDITSKDNVIRDRFITEIVGEKGNGMIWGLLAPVINGSGDESGMFEKLLGSNADLLALELVPVTLADVEAYEKFVASGNNDYTKTELTGSKMLSCAMYLAFEKAVIEGSKHSVISLDAFLNLGNLGGVFNGVMGELGNLDLSAVADVKDQLMTILFADIYEKVVVPNLAENWKTTNSPLKVEVGGTVVPNITITYEEAILAFADSLIPEGKENDVDEKAKALATAEMYIGIMAYIHENIKAIDLTVAGTMEGGKASLDLSGVSDKMLDIVQTNLTPLGEDYFEVIITEDLIYAWRDQVALVNPGDDEVIKQQKYKEWLESNEITIDLSKAFSAITTTNGTVEGLKVTCSYDKLEAVLKDLGITVDSSYNVWHLAYAVIKLGQKLNGDIPENVLGAENGIPIKDASGKISFSVALTGYKNVCEDGLFNNYANEVLGIEGVYGTDFNTMDIAKRYVGITYGGKLAMSAIGKNLTDVLSGALTSDDTLMGLLHLFGRCLIGNGLGVHPNENGHDTLYQAMVNAYENKITAQKYTIEKATNVLLIMQSYIEEYADELYEYGYQYADSKGYIDAVKNKVAELKAVLQEIKEWVENADIDGRVKDKILTLIQTAENALNKIINILANDLASTIAGLKAEIKGLLESVDRTIERIIALAERVANDTFTALTNKLNEINNKLHDIVNKVIVTSKEFAEQVKQIILAELLEAKGDLKAALASAKAKVKLFLEETTEKLTAAAKELYTEIVNQILAEVEALVDYAEAKFEALESKLAYIKEQLDAAVDKAIETVEVKYAELKQALVEIKAEIKAALAEVKELSEQAYAEIMAAAEEAIAKALLVAGKAKEIAEFAKEVAAIIIAELEAAPGKIEEALAAAKVKVEAYVKEVIAETDAALAELYQDVANYVYAVYEEAVAYAKGKYQEAKDILACIKEQVKDVVAEAVAYAEQKYMDLQAVVEEVKAAVKAAIQAAEDKIADAEALVEQIKAEAKQALADALAAIEEKWLEAKSQAEQMKAELAKALAVVKAESVELYNQLMEKVNGVVDFAGQTAETIEQMFAYAEEIKAIIIEELNNAKGDLKAALADAKAKVEEMVAGATAEAKAVVKAIADKVIAKVEEAVAYAEATYVDVKEAVAYVKAELAKAVEEAKQAVKEVIAFVQEVEAILEEAAEKAQSAKEYADLVIAKIEALAQEASETVKALAQEIITEIKEAAEYAEDVYADAVEAVAYVKATVKAKLVEIKAEVEAFVEQVEAVVTAKLESAENALKEAAINAKAKLEQLVADAKEAKELVKAIVNKVVAALDKAVEYATNTYEGLKEAVAYVEAEIAKAIEEVKAEVAELKEFASEVKAIITKLADSTGDAIEAAKQAVAEIKELAKDANEYAKLLAAKVVEELEAAIEYAQNAFEDATQAAEYIKGLVVRLINAVDTLVAETEELIDQLDSIFGQFVDIKDTINNALEAAKAAVDELISGAGEAAEIAKYVAAVMFKLVEEGVKALIETSTSLTEVLEAVVELVEAAAKTVTDINDLLAQFINKLDEIVAGLAEASGDVKEAVEQAIAQIEALIAEVKETLPTALAEIFETLAQKVISILREAAESCETIKEVLDYVKPLVKEAIDNLVEFVKNHYQDPVAILEYVRAEVKAALEALKLLSDELYNEVSSLVDSAFNAIKNAITNAEELKAFAEKVIAVILEELRNAGEDLEAAWECAKDKVYQLLADAIKGLPEELAARYQEVVEAIVKAVDDAVKYADGFLTSVQTKVNYIKAELKEAINEAIACIKEKYLDAKQTILDYKAQISEALAKAEFMTNELYGQLMDVVDEVFDKAIAGVESAKEIVKFVDQVKDIIIAELQNNVTSLQAALEAAKAKVEALVAEAGEYAEIVAVIAEQIIAKVEEAVAYAEAHYEDIKEAVAYVEAKLAEAVAEAKAAVEKAMEFVKQVEAIIDEIAENADDVQAAVEEAIAKIEALVAEAGEYAELVKAIAEKVIATLKEAAEYAETAYADAKEAVAYIKATAKEALAEIKAEVEAFVEQVKAAIECKIECVTNALQAALQEVKAEVEALVAEASQAAKAVVDQIMAEVEAAIEYAEETYANIVDAVAYVEAKLEEIADEALVVLEEVVKFLEQVDVILAEVAEKAETAKEYVELAIPQIEALVAKAGEYAEVIAKVAEQVIAQIKAAAEYAETAYADAKEAIAYIKAEAEKELAKLSEEFLVVLEKVVIALEQFDVIMNEVEAKFEVAEEKVKELIAKAEEYAEIYGPVAEEIIAAVKEVIDFAVEAYGPTKEAVEYIISVLPEVVEAVKETYIAVKPVVEQITEALNKAIEVIKDHPEEVKAIINAVAEGVTTIIENADEIVEFIKQVQVIIEEAIENAKDLPEAIAQAKAEVEALIAQAKAEIKAELEAIAEQIFAKVEEAVDFVEGVYGDALDAIEKIEAEYLELKAAIAQTKAEIEEALAEIKATASDVYNEIMAEVNKVVDFVEQTSEYAKEVIEYAKEVKAIIIAEIEAAPENLEKALEAAKEKVEALLAEAVEGVTEEIAALYNQVTEQIFKQVEIAIQYAEGVYNDTVEAVEYVINEVVTAVEEVIAEIEAAYLDVVANVEYIINNVETIIADALEQMYENRVEIIIAVDKALLELAEVIDDVVVEILSTYNDITNGIKEVITSLEAHLPVEEILAKFDEVSEMVEDFIVDCGEIASDALKEYQKISAFVKAVIKRVLAVETVEHYSPNADSFYVALGDSLVNGTGMEAATYSYLLAEALELDLNTQYAQLGVNGIRTNDLYYILNPEAVVDQYYLDNVEPIIAELGGMDVVRAEIVDAIVKADLITLQVGANNFGNYLVNQLMNYFLGAETYEMDWDAFTGYDLTDLMTVLKAEFADDLLAYAGLEVSEEEQEMLEDILDIVIFSYLDYAVNLEYTMQAIRAYNEDAYIVLTGTYNPFRDVYYDDGTGRVEVGQMIDQVVATIDTYLVQLGADEENCVYVEIPETQMLIDEMIEFGFVSTNLAEEMEIPGYEVPVPPYLVYAMMDSYVWLHPSTLGHEYIRDQILGVISHEINEEIWETDENGHWHACADCEEKFDYADHTFEWVIDSNPTTTDYGYKHEECTVCGYTRNENTPWGELVHECVPGTTWTTDATGHWHACSGCDVKHDFASHTFEWVVDQEAQEGVPGTKHEECTVCGYIQNEGTEIPALDHVHKPGTTWTTDATGHWHACSGCSEKLDFASHTFDWVVDQEAQVGVPGTKHEECTVCGYIQNEGTEIPALPNVHVHDLKYIPAKQSTCKERGHDAYYYCEGCDKYFVDSTASVETTPEKELRPLGGHTGGKATCSEKAVCVVCGRSYGFYGKHNLEYVEEVPATHKSEGIASHYKCKDCGKLFGAEGTELTEKDLVLDKIPHEGTGEWLSDETGHWHNCECGEKVDFAKHTFEWVVDKEPTTTEAGTKHEECTVCGYKQNEGTTIPATGHTHQMTKVPAKQATCEEDGNNEYYYCEDCGKYYKDANGVTETTPDAEKVKATGHTWGEWTVVTEATYDAPGLEERVCSCGEKETREIPQLVKEGLPVWAIILIVLGSLAVLGGAGYAAWFFYFKNKKQEKQEEAPAEETKEETQE
ncbi:MAG: hypothetical protein IJX78_03725 [Bacilli bacterium]|nr:hypothetical protein [Bacilli bacterium]